MSALTPREEDLVKILRSRTSDLSLDHEQLQDQHLIRWIRARDGDLAKADDMLRHHLNWRKLNKIDSSLLHWIPSTFLTETYSPKLCGFDSEGCPILLLYFGIWDIRPALARGEKENLIRYKDQVLEQIMRLMQIYENQRKHFKSFLSCNPTKITQFNCICDWSGFSMRYILSKEVVDVILDSARSFEANHPERLKSAYNVNCPKVFDILFKLVKPFLSERTMSKIFIYDSDETKWKPDILKALPKDQVPIRYGGTREKLWEFQSINYDLNQDGSFFKELFKGQISEITLENEAENGEQINPGIFCKGFKKVEIQPGDKVAIPFNLNSTHVTLKWSVKTKNDPCLGKLDFFIQCDQNSQACESNRETLLEKDIVGCGDEGEMVCHFAGNYWLLFGNPKSSNRGDFNEVKTVFYKLSMDYPAEENKSNSKCLVCCCRSKYE